MALPHLESDEAFSVHRKTEHFVWFHFGHPRQNHFQNPIVLMRTWHQQALRVDDCQAFESVRYRLFDGGASLTASKAHLQ